MCPGLRLPRLGQVCCYKISQSLVLLFVAFTPSICDASFSNLCCTGSELCEERPLCLCSPLYSKCLAHGRHLVNRRLNEAWSFPPVVSLLCVCCLTIKSHTLAPGGSFLVTLTAEDSQAWSEKFKFQIQHRCQLYF